MKKLIFLSFLLLMSVGVVYSQQLVLVGKVIDDSTQKPIPGATISLEKGRYTYTDHAGNFKINRKYDNDSLHVSAVGYGEVTLKVQSSSPNLIIKLRATYTQLEDVVINTGYQQLPKERATGSFELIDKNSLNRSASADIISRLEGITSIYFNHATQQKQLFIRGLSTLNANTEPLIILDNFPYEGNLLNIDPSDIEHITLLRDAAASSIWGAKAGNGVIVITTKRGKYNQQSRFQLNTAITIESKPDLFKARNYMNSGDFIAAEKFLFDKGYYNADLSNTRNRPVVSPVVELLNQRKAGIITETELNNKIEEYSKIDLRKQYLKYLYRPSVTQQYNASLTGGGNAVNYFIGFGYDSKITSLKGNESYKANLNSQINLKPLPNLEIEMGFIYTKASDTYNGMDRVVPGGSKSFMYPYAQLADKDGNSLNVLKDYRMGYTDTAGKGYLLNWKYNPLEEIANSDNTINRNDILIKLGVRYSFSKSLDVEIKGQMEKTAEISNYYYDVNTYYARNLINRFTQRVESAVQLNIPMGGILDRVYSNLLSSGIRGQLNYSTKSGEWYQLSALAGMEIRGTIAEDQRIRTYGYDNDVLTFSPATYNTVYTLWDKLGSGLIEPGANFSYTNNRYVSYFSNVAFRVFDKYIFTVSGRKDASNLFGVKTNQKWNPFWSAGAAWKISDEKFYQSTMLPKLKLRASYGTSGNILPGLSGKPVISYGSNYIISVPYASAISPANPFLRWEETATLNVGIDFGLKNNWLSGSFDYYTKKSTDLFSYVPVDPTLGTSLIMLNAANLSSKGFNLRLNSININRKIKWETTLLLNHVKNLVTKSFNEFANKGGYVSFGYTITPIEGKDPYALLSYKWAGLDPLTGDPQGYLNGRISKDYVSLTRPTSFDQLSIQGSSRPSFYGNIMNTFSYKRLSLSVNIGYAFGFYFRRTALNYYALARSWGMNQEFAERWQKSGDELNTNVPSMVYPLNPSRDNFYNYSEATIEKGDNIRLRDIRFSCQLFQKNSKTKWVNDAEVFIYAQNLGLLWTANKSGIDPDFGTYIPSPFNLTIGFKANF